jgi:hypothetical protein
MHKTDSLHTRVLEIACAVAGLKLDWAYSKKRRLQQRKNDCASGAQKQTKMKSEDLDADLIQHLKTVEAVFAEIRPSARC